ncbi:glucoamylase family protein [Cellulomonas fimi]|uniref:DUF3131 domain-containing protein n=1 Tax=Cellulomonas fimi TaxID=1708 RepID=A0A7Y0LZL4_CELFI|nr:glucoamylase family protein [Cellulomonas fimi]NMR20689.1 DUF3131 domain-containing protein [Cellulomonas fimi]
MTGQLRRRTAALAAAALATTGLVVTAGPAASGPSQDRATLMEYATDTWASFEAMVDPGTGLPADNIEGDLDTSTLSGYTSPTNIGAYLWSTVVARDLKIISRTEAFERLSQTLESVAALDRHMDSGMFYNWYSEATGKKLTSWPGTGDVVYPFLSSVDNGWLATALVLVSNAEPRLRDQAEAIFSTMDFGFYYDPVVGQIRGGFWDEQPPDAAAVLDNYRDRGPDVWYTGHHYGTLNTEPRIASYLGIAWGQIPPEHYFKMFRTFPDTCDWSWPEQKPVGEWVQYMGVDVFEGAYRYRGMQLVPTWGGSMFEALMVDLFIPEAEWGPKSWGVNHPLTVRAQIEHGMEEAGYGYWGFSPSSNPFGGYREYGVDPIGMEPNGYASDQPRTFVESGWDDPACFRAPSQPASYNDGVVTPHASFLALPYAKAEALDNLANLRRDFDAYGPGGFYDAIAVRSGTVAQRYLSLDQGMIMAALGNELRNDKVKSYVVRGDVRKVIRPLLGIEEFNVGG